MLCRGLIFREASPARKQGMHGLVRRRWPLAEPKSLCRSLLFLGPEVKYVQK